MLPPPHRTPAWVRLAQQMTHFFALLLWGAAALALVAHMPQLGITIGVVVVINGVFAFVQEYRADQAAERLGDMLPARLVVRRQGRPVEVEVRDVVVGDVVLLASGDRVPADLLLTEAHGMSVNTSALTGESVPQTVDVEASLMAGTFVVEGEGVALVTATGAKTRLAGLARLTRGEQRGAGPLAIELSRVVRTVAAIALGVGVAFFGVSVLVGGSLSDGFVFAIGVTVALVPEGLLPTVTLSLAMGAQRMASHHALVRRLEAVETLGATTFICTDKTGTLTRNQMSVVEVWTPQGVARIDGEGYEPTADVDQVAGLLPVTARLAATAVRCSTGRAVRDGDAWTAPGDPMEAAVDALARRLGVDVDQVRSTAVSRRFPFDPRRRRASVVTLGELSLKGAPDAVMARCRDLPPDVDVQVLAMAARGLRVLAVATRPAAEVGACASADEAERDLTLLGLLGLLDPPRPQVAAALAACRAAGVRVAMITGDHPTTARAVAEQVGLAGSVGLVGEGDLLVVQGVDLPVDDVQLGALLDRDGVVVARAEPEHKVRIALALRARGHVVAMTGDGVNDGPALQAADVGIAMGRGGTDVAREASDLVLLDDDFATIVAAIEQGRSTYANIRRFLTYHLTDNVAELTPFVVWALSGGSFPLAIGVLQVLFLDIGTDLLPALALGAERPAPNAMRGPPDTGHLMDRRLLVRVFGVLGPVEALVEMTAFTGVLVAAGWRPGGDLPATTVLLGASGAAFSAVVIGQMANAFACRSQTRPPWRIGWTGNRLLLLAVATELLALAAFLFVPPIADLLGHRPPSVLGVGIALLAAPAVLLADAAQKRWMSRH